MLFRLYSFHFNSIQEYRYIQVYFVWKFRTISLMIYFIFIYFVANVYIYHLYLFYSTVIISVIYFARICI